ncbi:hypothetical protein ACFQ07_25035 [Actinomadura adrarensis]|uniref:Uncharacterized protein n=1 Tax=Actinomadura adrarensis TaxID=1819600 RepID=A0ABW3CM00_9ACTN
MFTAIRIIIGSTATGLGNVGMVAFHYDHDLIRVMSILGATFAGITVAAAALYYLLAKHITRHITRVLTRMYRVEAATGRVVDIDQDILACILRREMDRDQHHLN